MWVHFWFHLCGVEGLHPPCIPPFSSNPSKCPRCEYFDKRPCKPKVSIHKGSLISWQTPFLRGLESTFSCNFTHYKPRNPLHPLGWTPTIPSHRSTLSGATWTFHLIIVWILPMRGFQTSWVFIFFKQPPIPHMFFEECLSKSSLFLVQFEVVGFQIHLHLE